MTTPNVPATTTPAPTGNAAQALKDREAMLVGALPEALQTQIRLRQLANLAHAQIANLQWGKNLDRGSARAIAEYARQFAIDPVQEIDLLGGNLYLNAKFYIRKLAELIAREDSPVEYAGADHVEIDARLDELGEDGKREARRRLEERIRHGIPNEAKSAVIFRVKLKGMTHELAAANWAGGGVKTKVMTGGVVKSSAQFDPIGEAEPVKTAETRAARRCMRFVISHMPAQMGDEIRAAEGGLKLIQPVIDDARERDAAASAKDKLGASAPRVEVPGLGMVTAGGAANPPLGERATDPYAAAQASAALAQTVAKCIGGPWAGTVAPFSKGVADQVVAIPDFRGEYRLAADESAWHWFGAPVPADDEPADPAAPSGEPPAEQAGLGI